MNVVGFNHLTLRVKSLNKSVDFYCHVLGMKLVHQGRTDVYLEWGNAWICLLEKPGYVMDNQVLGMDHIAFTVDEKTFYKAADRLAQQQVIFVREPVKRGGGLSLQFQDPDGIVLELTTDHLSKRMQHWT